VTLSHGSTEEMEGRGNSGGLKGHQVIMKGPRMVDGCLEDLRSAEECLKGHGSVKE